MLLSFKHLDVRFVNIKNVSFNSISSFGAQISAYSEIRAVRIVEAEFHSFLRKFLKIDPVCELMLMCHIRVSNFIRGGLNGYTLGI